jgi:hypothetical protein
LRGNEPTTTKEAEIIINGRNSGKIISIYAFRNVTELGKKNGLGWFSFAPKHFQGFFKRLLLIWRPYAYRTNERHHGRI